MQLNENLAESVAADGQVLTPLESEALQLAPGGLGESSLAEGAVSLGVWLTVLVAALGYFVDVVDLWLFSNFRVVSLQELGLTPLEVTNQGAFLLNCQQVGLLLGGILWGTRGDTRGRASVMFGSIILYSVGNLLNAFVTNVPQYAVLRFITGVGLAGEIGAGITLVCELLPKSKRGLGTTLVTGIGVAGALVAALMGKYLAWRTAYFIGGVMGLSLLFLRAVTHDSSLFQRMSEQGEIKRGSLRLLFGSWDLASRFVSCILVGAPIYLVMVGFAAFAPEIAPALGVSEPISVPDVMLVTAIGMTVGDLLAGLFSQFMRSRKLPLLILISLNCLTTALLIGGVFPTRNGYLVLAGLLGLFSGYWACLITTCAEQFGTNIRATATTMIPNLVRATAIPITTALVFLKDLIPINQAILVISVVVFALAFLGLWRLRESFHTDLDFYEVL